MARIPGDPGPLRWLRYAIGFRLPPENRDWVAHDLTDAGWRVRALVRQLVILVPVGSAFLVLPGAWSLKLGLMALIVGSGSLVTLTYADSLRASRLRQHALPVPDDPDLGRPTDSS
jgi:Family of unknown function (DUF5313)